MVGFRGLGVQGLGPSPSGNLSSLLQKGLGNLSPKPLNKKPRPGDFPICAGLRHRREGLLCPKVFAHRPLDFGYCPPQ